jgi:hypothetical protein
MVKTRTLKTVWYKCGICGAEFTSLQEAEECERKGVVRRDNLLVGDFILKDTCDIWEIVDIRQGVVRKHHMDAIGKHIISGVECPIRPVVETCTPVTPQKIAFIVKKLTQAKDRYLAHPDIKSRLPARTNNIQTSWLDDAVINTPDTPTECIVDQIERLGSSQTSRELYPPPRLIRTREEIVE